MKIESSWIFDCSPEDIFPHFFFAQMDATCPLAFLGWPKQVPSGIMAPESRLLFGGSAC